MVLDIVSKLIHYFPAESDSTFQELVRDMNSQKCSFDLC